jgi:ADP-ribosyl-[dinitrogen reductase] hydrolase
LLDSMSASDAASHSLPLRNCYWVVPGLLLAGEHPNGPTRDKTKDRLKKLLDAGIECFVDLTKPTELLRYDTFLPFYVEYARKSIKDHGVPTARSQMVEILEHIANSMRAGRPVYVHCRAGIGRTGTVVGCLLAERGMQGQATIDELNRLWQQSRRSRSWPFIPETDAQSHYVREWQPALDGGFELNSLATAVATVGSMSADGGVRGSAGSTSMAPDAAVGSRARTARAAGASASTTGGRSAGATEPTGVDSPTGATGPAGVDRRAGAAGSPPVGRGTNAAAGAGANGKTGGAGRPGGTGGGLRAAAEQARAAVERGEVQVKAPPVPTSTAGPTATPAAARGREVAAETAGTRGGARASTGTAAGANGLRRADAPDSPTAPAGAVTSPGRTAPPVEFDRGEIAPAIRAEIADAIAGRVPSSPSSGASATLPASQGTASPNGGEEAPWAVSAPASTSDTVRSRIPAQPSAGRRASVEPTPTHSPAVVENSPTARGPAAAGKSAAAEQMAAARASVASELSTSRSAAVEPPATARGSAAVQSAAAARAVRPPVEQPADSDPLLDPDTLAAARGLRERFLGTMFGLAVGDAVAAATQFRRPGTFTPIGDMLGGGPFDLPRGAYSDDTAMALCLAESLLERDGFDARDQVQRYSRWQQDGYLTSTGQCVGITASTARALALAKWRRGMVFPGSHDPEQLDPEPLSRIASIALFYFASLESTQQQAVDSSRITCQAPVVLDACRRLSRALNAALAGQPREKILAEGGPINEASVQANNTAAAALNAALWAFSSTDNFRDAVLRAANVGGNSDVVATVVGQLAGAHYGASAIPASWRTGLIQKDLIEGIADRMLAHGLVSLSS